MNPKPLLFIQPHLGLGDAIVCCGLVRELAKRHTILWPAKYRNVRSVKEMFADLDEVAVVPVQDDEEAAPLHYAVHNEGFNTLRLGIHAGRPLAKQWDKQMYEQAGVPFEKRWDSFVAPQHVRTKALYPAYAFLHDDYTRGFIIDRKRGNVPCNCSTPYPAKSIWDHLHWLTTAPEIHVIDSSFLCLADSVPTAAKRLVFHKYARPGGRPPTLRKAWEVLA